jgi:hypothetical protein
MSRSQTWPAFLQADTQLRDIARKPKRPLAEIMVVDHERVLVQSACRREAALSICCLQGALFFFRFSFFVVPYCLC